MVILCDLNYKSDVEAVYPKGCALGHNQFCLVWGRLHCDTKVCLICI